MEPLQRIAVAIEDGLKMNRSELIEIKDNLERIKNALELIEVTTSKKQLTEKQNTIRFWIRRRLGIK